MKTSLQFLQDLGAPSWEFRVLVVTVLMNVQMNISEQGKHRKRKILSVPMFDHSENHFFPEKNFY